MFRRLSYRLHLLNLRVRRRIMLVTRRLPRSFVRNLAVFYGALLVITLLVATGNNNLHLYQSIYQTMSRGAFALVSGGEQMVVPAMTGLVTSNTDLPKTILQRTFPILEPGPEPTVSFNGFEVLRDVVRVVTNYDLTNPRSFVTAGLPRYEGAGVELPRIRIEPAPKPAKPPVAPPEPKPPVQPPQQEIRRSTDWGDKPLIALYHTHNSETFHRPGRNPARVEDYHIHETVNTGIMRVGAELARTLEEIHKIPVIHSKRLHDVDGFLRCYINSLETAKALVADNPQLEMIFDVHRDGVPEMTFLTNINGQQVGQILIIVTTDAYGLAHPRWRQNLAFARFLHDKMEEIYPGLSRGVRIVNTARYNQHVHPRALLLEIGNYNHEEEAAIRSARLFAHVLAVALEEL